MDAGTLRERVTIQQKTVTRNAIGEEQESAWTTVATVWASYRPIKVSEMVAGAQLTANFEAVFRIRNRSDIDEEMRLIWRGVTFEIAAPPLIVDQKKREIDLFVRKGIRDGR